MITEKERQFIVYWEQERERLGTVRSKLLNGLPMAVVFTLPVLLLVIVIRLFFPEWYTKISNSFTGSLTAVLIALFICVLFFAYFRMHYKWEMNEQLYQELKHRSTNSKSETENK